MRQVVVHDEDEVAMGVTCGRLSDSRVIEVEVVPFPEMLLVDDAQGAALGHVGGMGGSDVSLTGVAILIGEIEFNDTIVMSVDVDAFDVDGVAEPGVAARDERIMVGLQFDVGTTVDKAKGGRRGGQRGAIGRR
jgi:hypothetical protein